MGVGSCIYYYNYKDKGQHLCGNQKKQSRKKKKATVQPCTWRNISVVHNSKLGHQMKQSWALMNTPLQTQNCEGLNSVCEAHWQYLQFSSVQFSPLTDSVICWTWQAIQQGFSSSCLCVRCNHEIYTATCIICKLLPKNKTTNPPLNTTFLEMMSSLLWTFNEQSSLATVISQCVQMWWAIHIFQVLHNMFRTFLCQSTQCQCFYFLKLKALCWNWKTFCDLPFYSIIDHVIPNELKASE